LTAISPVVGRYGLAIGLAIDLHGTSCLPASPAKNDAPTFARRAPFSAPLLSFAHMYSVYRKDIDFPEQGACCAKVGAPFLLGARRPACYWLLLLAIGLPLVAIDSY
jgi:hypothetical protein